MNLPIYPCLWMNGTAKEAAQFYSTVFPDTRITSENPVVVTFEAAGQKFMCLNGGPEFTINPSISFFVICETAEEVDALWNQLSDGGITFMPLNAYPWSPRYGWIQDRFGVSWQLMLAKLEDYGQKFVPDLLFTREGAGKAEEAVQFYTSLFEPSSIIALDRYTKEDQDREGLIKHARFKLGNQAFVAMDSSAPHQFSFNEAVSLVVECQTQQQIDHLWNKLTEGGSEEQCGWLKDRFGVSWQIVPAMLGELMSEPQRAARVMQEILKMKKLDIATLQSVQQQPA